MANFMKAIKWLREGKKITRKSKSFKKEADYISLGIDDEYEPNTIEFFKNNKWLRSCVLWIEDYEADDWRVYNG